MMLRTAVQVALIGIATTIVGIAGTVIGFYSTDDLSGIFTHAVVMRSVVVIVILLVMTRAFRISDRGAADHTGRPYQLVLVAAALSYALNLAVWSGQVLFGQLLVPEQHFFSAVLDTATWMAVALAGVLLGDRARVQATTAPAPYA